MSSIHCYCLTARDTGGKEAASVVLPIALVRLPLEVKKGLERSREQSTCPNDPRKKYRMANHSERDYSTLAFRWQLGLEWCRSLRNKL